MAKTYNDLYLDARKRLKQGGIEGYELEARELLSFAAGKNREELYRDMRLYAVGDIEARMTALLDRRLGGEPTAYIVGEWEFYGLDLEINRNVLIPRADTEVLAARAIEIARKGRKGFRVLDLCAGSGCIGLAIASGAADALVVMADCSEDALRICRSNARRHKLSARALCVSADALEDPSPGLSDFDMIVSNPPYIPTEEIQNLDPSVRDFEPHLALDGGPDGLDFYHSIASRWKRALRPGGVLLMEVGIHQARAVEEILSRKGFVNIKILADTNDILRVVEGTLPG